MYRYTATNRSYNIIYYYIVRIVIWTKAVCAGTKKEGEKWSAINYLYSVLVATALRILGKQTRLIDFGRMVKKKSKFHDNYCSAGMYDIYMYIYILLCDIICPSIYR